jgi:hypothetical protein
VPSRKVNVLVRWSGAGALTNQSTKVDRHVAPSVTSMPHGSRVRSRVFVFDRFLISLA